MPRIVFWLTGVVLLAGLGWLALHQGGAEAAKGGRTGVAPVAVAPVLRETIELRRVFSGTLESPARFVVAPKVGGRLLRLTADLADPVENGQVVAQLDDEEYRQAVVQAEADLEVARAQVLEADSHLAIARRETARVASLREQGIAAESQVDAARAQLLTREAAVQVTKAQLSRAEAVLAGARTRLGYTQVTAYWSGGGHRFVAERHLNAGATVAANTPLLTIVELDPMIAAVSVTERDYGLLRIGQAATLRTDAFGDTGFEGRVARLAPAFSRDSRQARIEISVANPHQRLKPGMFVRVEVVLDRVEDAATVPLSALVTRNDKGGVFVVNDSGDGVAWHPVEAGIRQDDRVQLIGENLSGRVVTMGQHLIDDGSPVTIPESETEPSTR